LKQRIIGCAGAGSSRGAAGGEGYDSLDALVSGFLLTEVALEEIRQQEPEMVFYQPTPARIILEMAEKSDLQQDDVFYDIGSGLGQVSILMHLLTGVRAKGVEVESAYCDYARRCARRLNLLQVEFINVDAREADYSDGTIFFLYTPFEGRMLEQVLERLRHESRNGRIQLYTYGPCTLQVARQKWLECVDQTGNHANRLAIFRTPERELESAQPPRTPDQSGRAPNQV
jgi:SAM-dependent methyltransferase